MRVFLLILLLLISAPAKSRTWNDSPSLLFAAKIMVGDLAGAAAMVVGKIEQSNDGQIVVGKSHISTAELFEFLKACRIMRVIDRTAQNVSMQDKQPSIEMSFVCGERGLEFYLVDTGRRVSIERLEYKPPPPRIRVVKPNG